MEDTLRKRAKGGVQRGCWRNLPLLVHRKIDSRLIESQKDRLGIIGGVSNIVDGEKGIVPPVGGGGK